MTAQRRQIGRAAALRVALAATAIVAVVYLAVGAGVVAIVTQNLTGQIDARLADSLSRIGDQPPPPPAGGFPTPDVGPRFGPALIVWTIHPDGDVTCNDPNAVLPAAYEKVTGPETISVGGTGVRVRGAARGDAYVVVGQTTGSVTQAQQTIVLAETLIGPLLLLLVFLGSLAIGRRVAAPLERAHQRQLEFAADASHELRTPLSVIEAQTTLALSRERDSAWYRAAFARVEVESRRMHGLVDALLWLARFDATDRRPAAEPVDLGVLAAQAVDRFGAVAATRRLALSLQVGELAPVVAAPPEWLDQLLGVLLDNACKYSPEGGRVDVRVSTAGGRVHLTVDDAGPGIPVEERERIFDRFHRASQASGGSGLGLAIADAIVRSSGGRWHVASSSSGGASMGVSWPRALTRA